MSTCSVEYGVRDDNRLENLELWVRPQPAGQRVEDLVDWMIENYKEEITQRMGMMQDA